jgi:hypothetical protein
MRVMEPPVATTKFVAVNVTAAARDELRHAAVIVSAALGRRVSMADAVLVLKAIADRHPDEIGDTARQVLEESSHE